MSWSATATFDTAREATPAPATPAALSRREQAGIHTGLHPVELLRLLAGGRRLRHQHLWHARDLDDDNLRQEVAAEHEGKPRPADQLDAPGATSLRRSGPAGSTPFGLAGGTTSTNSTATYGMRMGWPA